MRWTILLTAALLLNGCGAGESPTDMTSQTVQPPPPVIQPPPPAATTRPWVVHGQTTDGGTFDGTFTYEKDAAPIAENVRGNQNVIYPLKAWDIQAHPTYQGIPLVGLPPVLFFKNTGFVDTSELCFNECIFDPNDFSRLMVSNGLQTLILAFRLPAPHTMLPGEAGDSGVFQSNASDLRSVELSGAFQYLMVVRSVDITAVN